ncbi:MAG: epoxyqueuosine reductase [Gemmatimonadota bacterium]|nr:MAG: epoxyqueuosine reductase [Gemmatimonadota bacterium]
MKLLNTKRGRGMEYLTDSASQSRRDFMKNLVFFCSLLHLKPEDLLALSGTREGYGSPPDIVYQHRTLSLGHFKELQEDIDILKRKGKLSRNKTFRSYIDDMRFEIPENFPDAQSIIVLATFTRMMYVNFHLGGKKYDIMLPPQYYDDGISIDDLKGLILKDIIQEPGYRIEKADKVHLKLLAVRSGLGTYGRNNLCFVDGMGNFLTLYAFLTDFKFEENHWHELKMLDLCKNCRICYGICPTNCITEEHFVIDVGKCVTLYNEVEGTFPRFLLPSMHNALMGCMKCQVGCPENEKFLRMAGRLEDVTEEETRKILKGEPDEHLLDSLGQKLRKFYPACEEKYFPIFTRNLRVLIS